MQKNISNNHLSPTSLFVLFLAGRESYPSRKAQKYLNFIDVSEVPLKIKKYIKICSFYDQIIKNRKHCIKKMCFDFLSKNKTAQVVILAAGLDPLSLEITSRFPKAKVFEIDTENMNIKTQLLNDLKNFGFINCISANLTNPLSFKKKLIKAHWDNTKTTLVIAEGISYYLSYKHFWNIIKLFSSAKKNNCLIMEYLTPLKEVSLKYRKIPTKTFKQLSKDYNLSKIFDYTQDLLNKYVQNLKGEIKTSFTLQTMEKQRCKKNTVFKTTQDSWINVSKIII